MSFCSIVITFFTFLFLFPLSTQSWNLNSFGLKYQDGEYLYMKYSQHFCDITQNPSACFNDIICIHYETQADVIGLMYLDTFLETYQCNITKEIESTPPIDEEMIPGFILGSINVKMQFSTIIIPSVCNSTLSCVHNSICNYSPKNQGYIFSVAMIPLSRSQCNSTSLDPNI